MEDTNTKSLDEIGLKYTYDFGKRKTYTGGDKTSMGHNFTERYDQLFQKIRFDSIKFLELGVFYGKSLVMWSDYFPNGHIYGIDISLKRYNESIDTLKRHGAFKNNNISVFEQDITSDDFKDFLNTLPDFDVIVDDAAIILIANTITLLYYTKN